VKAYSQDLRERVIRAVDQGMSQKEAARIFGVSPASIKRYLKQRRETGSLAPRSIPGRPKRKIGPLLDGLRPQLEAHPDATLEEHCRLWEAETGAKVSPSTMGRAIHVGFTVSAYLDFTLADPSTTFTTKHSCWASANRKRTYLAA